MKALWQCSPASNPGCALVMYIHEVITHPDMNRSGWCCCSSGNRCLGMHCCLGRYNREMQLRISFRLPCCHALLAKSLFWTAGGQCLSARISPVHNMTRLRDAPAFHVRLIRIHIESTIVISIWVLAGTQSEISYLTEISASPAYRVYLNQCSSWQGQF
jgi:hypothetical protein